MRKKIESKEVNRKEVKPLKEVKEKNMETIESVYVKMMRRISYLKDRDTTSQLLDYQDALQTVMTDIWGKQIDNPKHYIRRAVSFTMRDNRREISLENFGDSLEVKYSIDAEGEVKEEKYLAPALIVNSQGEIVDVIHAIASILSPIEREVFDFYTQGFTCKEIASKVDSNEKSIQRQVKRIYDKIDTLKVSYFYNSKYATFQGKQGKDGGPKYDSSKVYNVKLDGYVDSIEVMPNEVVNRNFLCLDQSKAKKTLLPANYQGNMIVNRKEAIVQIADALDKNKYSVVIMNSQYMDSTLPAYSYNPTEPYANNQEAMQLYANRKQYNKMIRDNSTVHYESRYKIEFMAGRFISTDHKYKDLP